MVRNSDKTYGEHMQKAREMTDSYEMGELQPYIEKRIKEVIEEAVQKQAEQGKHYPKYYIWIKFRKEAYSSNALHLYPQCRISRPSPYQDPNHALWSVTNMNEIKSEWSVMDAGMRKYVLANPNLFHQDAVAMAKKYASGKIEKLEDYLVDGKVI